ncbi:hypothetical protein D3C80_1246590 [compost metagenome]
MASRPCPSSCPWDSRSLRMICSCSCCSPAESQLAPSGLSLRQRKQTTPTKMIGSASSRNIHCQPAQPLIPPMFCMISPETGPPRIGAVRVASSRIEVTRPRR